MLASATQLSVVRLHGATVQRQAGMSNGAALLSAVGELRQLEDLALSKLGDRVDWPAPSAAYSVLTAHSTLQALSIGSCRLPVGAWAHVFSPATCSPGIRRLSVLGEGG